MPLTLAPFTPADPLGWPWYYYVLAVAGGLLALIVILAIIGSILNARS